MSVIERVLVVGDDSGVAGGIVRGPRDVGFEVELATNGKDGAKKAWRGTSERSCSLASCAMGGVARVGHHQRDLQTLWVEACVRTA
jgi:hypothetical protein